MSNVSSSLAAGWLRPAPGPEEPALEDVLHEMICALTGLPGPLVRPRWQPKPPAAPGPDVDWCALGIVSEDAPGGAAWHEGGSTRLAVHEVLTVLCSFYGPHAREHARAVRDGLWVEQNRAMLREPANLALVRVGGITPAPELVDGRWQRRQDMSITFTRGPWLGKREPREGATNIKDLKTAQACGLCGRSR